MNEKKAKILIYKKNAVPYWLILLAICAEVYYTVIILGNMATDYRVGLVIIINIIMIFGMFTCAVKVNVYDMTWSLVAAALAAYVVCRTVYLIPTFVQPTGKQGQIIGANVVQAGLMFVGALISVPRIVRRDRALEAEGKG